MKAPSDVTVLSESDPTPSLLPLLLEALESLSSSERLTAVEITNGFGRGGADLVEGLVVDVGGGTASFFSGFETDDLRPPEAAGELLATTLDTDTEVVTGVIVGLLT